MTVRTVQRAGTFGAAGLLGELARIPSARLVLPADPDFAAAGGSVNTDITAQPLAVVECGTTYAVAAVVRSMAEAGVPLAVRGGGWSVAGLGTVDGGIVLSVRPLQTISIDDQRVVRVGAGVRAGELEAALAPHGLSLNLPVPSGVSVLGNALSGGVGFTLRKVGFAADEILSATVVTGTGEVVEADDKTHPDLMWALRGGGGNVGVVVEATLQATEVPFLSVTQGFFALGALEGLLRFLPGWAAELPDEATVVLMGRALPPLPSIPAEHHGRTGVIVSVIHCGGAGDAAATVAPLLARPGRLAQVGLQLPPLEFRAVTDAHSPASFGVRCRSTWLADLHPRAVAAFVAAGEAMPPGLSLFEIAVLGGAVAAPRRPSAAPGRDAGYFVNVMAMWTDEDGREPALRWLAAVDPDRQVVDAGAGVVPGFVSRDQLDEAGPTYGAFISRLRAVKAEFDPHDVFRHTLHIAREPAVPAT